MIVRVAARTTLVALALSLGACQAPVAPPSPGFDQLAADLAKLPAGDGPWREAVDIAAAAGRTGELAALCQRLASTHPERWQPAWTRGRCLDQLEDHAQARASFQESLRRARQAGDAVGIARSADDLGWHQYLAGELGAGERSFHEALEAAARAGRRDLLAFIRNNLAPLLIDRGEIAAAIEQFEQVERGLSQLGLDGPARGAAYNAAVLMIELGDAHSARRALEELHEAAQEAGDRWTVDASAVVLGNLCRALEFHAESLDWHNQVSQASPELWARAQLGLGRAALLRGEFDAARSLLESSAASVREQDRPLALLAESFLAAAAAGAGDMDGAIAGLGKVIDDAGESGAAGSSWVARWLLARTLGDAGQPAAALVELRQAVATIVSQRASLDPRGEGLRFLRERREPFVDLALALRRSPPAAPGNDNNAEVFAVLQLAKSRLLETEVASTSSLESIRNSLDEGDLLLDYLLGAEEGLVLALTRETARVVPIAGRRKLLPPLARYREALRRPLGALASREADLAVEDLSSGRELRALLLGPVEDLVAKASRLLVVPDRELALLPFAALPAAAGDDRRYLGLVLETAVLPLAGGPPQDYGPRTPVLLAGQPRLDPDSGLAPLPWAAYELSHLREIWPGDESAVLTGAHLTAAELASLPPESLRTVHLATHALASTRDPRLCGVVLADGERLGIDRIATLELHSSLVILSACRTGEGELVPGEGVIGLGRAFLSAGATGVLVSLWSADDSASARLMVEFHRQLRAGADPVSALASARRSAAARRPHPAYWAAFDLLLRPASAPRK